MRKCWLFLALFITVINLKVSAQTLGDELKETYLEKFNTHQQINQQQLNELIAEVQQLNPAQAWQQKSRIRSVIWRYLSTPQLFNYWTNCTDLPEDIKNGYLIDKENIIENSRLAIFTKQIEFKGIKLNQHPKDCFSPLNINLTISSSANSASSLSQQDLLFKQLLMLLHLDETSEANLLFNINKPDAKYINGRESDNLSLWLIGLIDAYRDFHDQYSFEPIKLSSALAPISSGKNDSYIAAVETISWQYHQSNAQQAVEQSSSPENQQMLFDFINRKEAFLEDIQQSISVCVDDQNCTPNNLSMWFYNASHIHPPLSRYQPQLKNNTISAILPRSENHWLTVFLSRLQQQYQNLPTLKRQTPPKTRPLETPEAKLADILLEAPLWPQVKKLDENGIQFSNLPIREGIQKTKLRSDLTDKVTQQGEVSINSPQELPLVYPEVFSRLFSHTISDVIATSVVERNLTTLPKITIESNWRWHFALNTKQTLKLINEKIELPESNGNSQIYNIELSIVDVNNDDQYKQIKADILLEQQSIRSVNFRVKTPWPFWFAQPKFAWFSISTLSAFLLIIFILVFAYLAIDKPDYKQNWPYSDDKHPKRKRFIARCMLVFPIIILFVLTIFSPLAPMPQVEQLQSSHVHFYLPDNKGIDKQYQNIVTQVSTKIFSLYQNDNIEQQGHNQEQVKNSLLDKVAYWIVSGFDEFQHIVDWYKGEEITTPLVPPKFNISKYGWFPNDDQPDNSCESQYSSYGLADFTQELKRCWQQPSQQQTNLWQADIPPSYIGNNIDSATSTIIFYDGNHGQLQQEKLKIHSQPQQRIISIFIPSYTTNSKDILVKRLSWVVEHSDATCILLLSTCLPVDKSNVNNIALLDFDQFQQNPDLENKQHNWLKRFTNNSLTTTDLSNQALSIIELVRKVDPQLGIPSSNIAKEPLERIQLKLPHSQWRGLIITVLASLLIVMAFYYHQDTPIKTIPTGALTLIVCIGLTYMAHSFLLGAGQLFVTTNGTPLNTIVIYLLCSVIAFMLLPTLFIISYRITLTSVSKHPFIKINKAAPFLALQYKSRVQSQTQSSPLFVGIALLLFMLAITIWSTAPVDLKTPQLLTFTFGYSFTMFIATLCWILGALVFYHPNRKKAALN